MELEFVEANVILEGNERVIYVSRKDGKAFVILSASGEKIETSQAWLYPDRKAYGQAGSST